MDSLLSMIPGFAIILLSLVIVIYRIYKPIKSCCSNLPSNRWWWPIVGDTLAYVSRPEKFFRDRMTKLSPDAFQTSLLGEKMAVLCGPLANKFLFSNEAKLVNLWWPRSITDPLFHAYIDHESLSWKMVHEESLKFLRLEYLKSCVGVMDAMTREHLDTLWAPFYEVRVHQLAKQLTFAVSCRLFLKGSNMSPEVVRELAEPFMQWADGVLTVPVNVPGTSYRRALNLGKLAMQKTSDMIRLRKSEISTFDQNDHGHDAASSDLLGRLLMASDKDGKLAHENDIVVKLMSFLLGSFSATSGTITSLVNHLAEHSQVYEKVLQEQLEIAQSKRPGECLNWEDIQKMRYSWNTVCESMRLTPPGIAGGFREAITDFTYEGFNIPKGWKVHWTMYSTNKDPKYFPDPEKFDPSRFEGKGPLPFTFAPFGGGPRMCKGVVYARMQILVFLHRLVTRFRLKKTGNRLLPMEDLRIFLQPHDK